MVRGSLVTAIYTHTLELPIDALDETAAITLMSSDLERICEALLPIHNLWSSPLEIVLAIWLLHREIGIGLLGPLLVTALAIAGPFLVSGHMGLAQVAWIEGIQVRIDGTAKMLQVSLFGRLYHHYLLQFYFGDIVLPGLQLKSL